MYTFQRKSLNDKLIIGFTKFALLTCEIGRASWIRVPGYSTRPLGAVTECRLQTRRPLVPFFAGACVDLCQPHSPVSLDQFPVSTARTTGM